MARKPATVSQINDYINKTVMLDPLLSNVLVKGQVTNLKYHTNGNIYFSIIDNTAKLNCIAFYDVASNFSDVIIEGDEVILSGYINVYSKGGSYSLVVRSIEILGTGSATIEFDELKEKLSKEGLFDKAHKKELPEFPRKLAIVTAQTGAAIQDILKIITERNNVVDIYIFPALVQGTDASISLISALNEIESDYPDMDLVIIGRGGGSKEDLSAFNDESLARAIYDFSKPIISAVGHEIDISISDFVADVSAPTPTAAAQMAVPNIDDILERLDDMKGRIERQIVQNIDIKKLELRNLKKELLFNAENIIKSKQVKIEKQLWMLKNNNPLAILDKGYTLLMSLDGNVLNISDIKAGNDYSLQFNNGKAKVRILEVNENE